MSKPHIFCGVFFKSHPASQVIERNKQQLTYSHFLGLKGIFQNYLETAIVSIKMYFCAIYFHSLYV